MKQYRQGDVLITTSEAPEDSEKMGQEDGLVTLARGEVTGHHHSILGTEAYMLSRGAERFLAVPKHATLTHQEHGPIKIARGTYKVEIQKEYDPTVISRTVLD